MGRTQETNKAKAKWVTVRKGQHCKADGPMDENIIKIKDFYDRRSNCWRSYQKKKRETTYK